MPVSDMIEYSRHARVRMAEEQISEAAVQLCLSDPDFIEPDPDTTVIRFLRCVPGHSRKIRVVVRSQQLNFVVTAHPDRRFRCPPQYTATT